MTPSHSPQSDTTPQGITLALTLSMLLASLGTSIANIALPTLSKTFSAPFTQVQLIVIGYLVALTVSVFIAGHLGDRYGLRRMLLLGLALFTFGALLCGLAPDLEGLIAARILQGIGAAFLMTLSMALMRETASEARVGQAMGWLGTMSALGTALGPSLGGVLISITGWRSLFLVQIPISLLALALLFTHAQRPRETHPKHTPSAPQSAIPWKDALIPALLVNLLVACVMMSTLVVSPFYLGIGLGLKATMVGLIMSVGPAISIFGGVPAGRLVDAWGSHRVLSIGLCMLACGAMLLACLPHLIGVVGYLLAIGILTPGYQLFQSANNTATLASAPKDRRGTVSGLLSLSRNIGLIIGASGMGSVFSLGIGTTDFTQATATAMADGMQLTFGLASVLLLMAIGIERERTRWRKVVSA